MPALRRARRGKAGRYCCSGCEHVHEILQAVDAEQGAKLLAEARRMGLVPEADSLPEAALAAEKAWSKKPSPDPASAGQGEGFRSERFLAEGFACPSCAWLSYAVLIQQPGVVDAEADFLSDSVRITYDMRRTGPHELAGALKAFGYGLEPLTEGQSPEENLFSRLLARFSFALFLALNVMMLSAVHWASYIQLIPQVNLRTVALVQLGLVLPLLAVGVWPLLKRSATLIRMGRPSMDLLFVIGFSAAFGLSVAAFFSDGGQFYFDTCAAFIAISLLGRLVEGKLRLKAARELRGLLQVAATKVAICDETE